MREAAYVGGFVAPIGSIPLSAVVLKGIVKSEVVRILSDLYAVFHRLR